MRHSSELYSDTYTYTQIPSPRLKRVKDGQKFSYETPTGDKGSACVESIVNLIQFLIEKNGAFLSLFGGAAEQTVSWRAVPTADGNVEVKVEANREEAARQSWQRLAVISVG